MFGAGAAADVHTARIDGNGDPLFLFGLLAFKADAVKGKGLNIKRKNSATKRNASICLRLIVLLNICIYRSNVIV